MATSAKLSEQVRHLKFLESVIDIQNELICRFLPDTTLTFVNKSYCDFFNSTREQLLGSRWIGMIPDDQQQMISDHLHHVGRSGDIITYEHAVMVEGEVCWQQWTDHPLYDNDGNLVEFQAVGRDITSAKQYEQRLIKINQSKDHILTTVAHDLRDPISGIIGLCRMMEKSDPHGQNNLYLKLIKESCHHSLHIMEELLEMAELENDSFRMNKNPEIIGEIILDVISGFEQLAREKKIHLKADLPRRKVVAMVSRPRIQRVLTNILSNAMKFTSQGGNVVISLKQSHNKVIIQIRDTGIGIPKELTPGIFDKFTKGKRSGLDGEKTHGLGLFICKQIMEHHQGNISLDSEEGKGTQLTLELPALKM